MFLFLIIAEKMKWMSVFFASIFLFIIFFRPNLFGLSSEQLFVLIGRDVCLFLRSNLFKLAHRIFDKKNQKF